jgi:hypothetical protein
VLGAQDDGQGEAFGVGAAGLGGGAPGSHPGRPAEVNAQVVVRLATIGTDGPTGTFQEDAGDLGW